MREIRFDIIGILLEWHFDMIVLCVLYLAQFKIVLYKKKKMQHDAHLFCLSNLFRFENARNKMRNSNCNKDKVYVYKLLMKVKLLFQIDNFHKSQPC